MKTIGIIGGMAPESTILYYKYITEESRRRLGDHVYPRIIIYSVDFSKFIEWMNSNNWDSIANELINITFRLRNAGADFAIIATNTMHIVFDRVLRSSPIPLISIIDAVAEEINRYNISKVGLLGTKLTMESGIYADGLAKYRVEVLIPGKEDREYIDNIIFNELTKGIISFKSKAKFIDIVNKMIKEGIEGLILGCTEIPLLINQGDVSIKIFDSTRIHALKALEYALK